MVDYIGSDTIKKYYEENGIVLSDRMIAARICTGGFHTGEVHSSLREIQARTEDADLKRQIYIYIGRETSMYEKMKKSMPGDIYRLSVWYKGDREYSEDGYYTDFGVAQLAARELRQKEKNAGRYKIEKFHVMDRTQFPPTDEYWSLGGADGCAEYDSNGELTDIWSCPEEDEVMESLFAEEYFNYPHPFKRGDILMKKGDERSLYIINMDMDPEAEAEWEKRRASWGDSTDIGIYATAINRRTGRIWDMDGPIHPFEFEYAHIDEKTEDIVEQAALEMQRIMLGKRGSFQYIYDVCVRKWEDYLEKDRVSLITGIQLHSHNVLMD